MDVATTASNVGVNTTSDMVAERIQAIRQSYVWSARQLASRCAAIGAVDLTSAVIANIESGRRDVGGRRRRNVTVDELLAIALALGVAPVKLLQPPDKETTIAVTPDVFASQADLVPWLKDDGPTALLTLLRGLALCGSCRTPINARTSPYGLMYFCANPSCHSPVIDYPADWADAYFERIAFRRLTAPATAKLIAGNFEADDDVVSLDSRIADMTREIEQLRDRREETRRELRNLADYPHLSPKDVDRAIASFDRKIQALQSAVAEMKQRILLERATKDVGESWEHAPLGARRAVINSLMTAIIAHSSWGNIEPESRDYTPGDLVFEWRDEVA
jgi:transcriptional regulator with XRE-family HTH domain